MTTPIAAENRTNLMLAQGSRFTFCTRDRRAQSVSKRICAGTRNRMGTLGLSESRAVRISDSRDMATDIRTDTAFAVQLAGSIMRACHQSAPGKQLLLFRFVRIGRGRMWIGSEKRRCDFCGTRISCFCDSMRGTGASTFLRMRNPREGATGFGIGMYARCFCNREDRILIVIRRLKWHRMDCGLIWRLLQEKNAICAAACASV